MKPSRGFDSGSNPDGSTNLNKVVNFTGLINTYYKSLDNEDFTVNHRKCVKRFLDKYLIFCGGNISLDKTIEFLTALKQGCDIAYYCKQYWQIKKLLTFIDAPWVNKLKNPDPKQYSALKITDEQFNGAIQRFNGDLQMLAVLHLGKSSGMRSFEIYQLDLESIDIENRIIHVNRENGKTTKNLQAIREAYFDIETQTILKQYLNYFQSQFKYDKLFSMQTITKKLKGSGFKLKHTRHLFARNAVLIGVPSGLIKRFLGQSIKRDVLESNYTFLSNEDLHGLYNKYFGGEIK